MKCKTFSQRHLRPTHPLSKLLNSGLVDELQKSLSVCFLCFIRGYLGDRPFRFRLASFPETRKRGKETADDSQPTVEYSLKVAEYFANEVVSLAKWQTTGAGI